LSTENLHKKLNTLLTELQAQTGATDEELKEFKMILELANFSEENN
tara:strand:+ start:260 stop:397 length:138 start_codon:yes stop_codon:yes gene_type:complete